MHVIYTQKYFAIFAAVLVKREDQDEEPPSVTLKKKVMKKKKKKLKLKIPSSHDSSVSIHGLKTDPSLSQSSGGDIKEEPGNQDDFAHDLNR